MKDIAAKAGCSVMTVSLALRDNPRISLETRERIRALATSMGYRPNPMVATLMAHISSGRSIQYQANLAFLVSKKVWMHPWIKSRVFEGIRQRAEALGFLIDIFWTEDYAGHPGRIEKILRSRNIQGVIVAPLPESGNLDNFEWSEWSAASIGNSLLVPRLHRITHHQFHGMALIHEILRKKGYSRIGLAVDKLTDDKVDHNWSSCAAGIQLRLPSRECVPVFLGELNPEPLSHWLKKYRPDAVIGHDGLLENLLDVGVCIPTELAFAHVSLPSTFSSRKLSGLDQNWPVVGAAAVDTVVAQIHRNERGIPSHPKTVMIEGRWIEGETVPGVTVDLPRSTKARQRR